MKIIALLPFKNEDWIIEEYIHSIKKVADEVIAFDDNSTDTTRSLLERAGVKIIQENYEKKSGWAEYSIRERLLTEGRDAGGTHFICLDSDEIFSNNFITNGRDLIASLKPGQSLWMDWVNLYKDLQKERIDGVYKKLNKSFIFCDDGKATFLYAFLGVSRTPGDPLNRLVIPREKGAVIHFQFLNMKRALMKRAWYMCSELIKGDRIAQRINATYEIQKDISSTKTISVGENCSFELVSHSITAYERSTDWRFKEILSWFEKYDLSFFEPLDIWEDDYFYDFFLKEKGRPPKPKKIPSWILKMNSIKNSMRNMYNVYTPAKKK